MVTLQLAPIRYWAAAKSVSPSNAFWYRALIGVLNNSPSEGLPKWVPTIVTGVEPDVSMFGHVPTPAGPEHGPSLMSVISGTA